MKDFLLTRPFISIFLQNFLFFCSLNSLNVLSGYLEKAGAAKSYIGLFMNLNSLSLVFFVLLLTHWTEKTGRKKVLLAGYLLAIVGAPLMFFSYHNQALLLALRLLGTLGFCAAFTINSAEAFALIPKDRRMAGIAIFGVGGLMSNPVSSFGGETVAKLLGPEWVFLLTLVFAVPAFLLAAGHRFSPGTIHENPTGLLAMARRPNLRPLVLITLTFGGAFAVFSTFLANLTLLRLGEVLITPYFTAFSLTAIAGRFLFSHQLDRLPKHWLVAGALTSMTVGFALTFGLYDAWVLVPMGIFYGLGHSLLFPVLSTLFVNSGPEEERFLLNNTFSAVNTLGNVALATLFGSLGDLFGIQGIFALQGGLMVVVIPYAFLALRKSPI